MKHGELILVCTELAKKFGEWSLNGKEFVFHNSSIQPSEIDIQNASLKVAKNKKLKEINTAFAELNKSSVDCIVDEITYTMNFGEQHMLRLQAGIELAEILGESDITILDFYNVEHMNVSFDVANTIVVLQASAFKTAWNKRNSLRTAINKAADIETLSGLNW